MNVYDIRLGTDQHGYLSIEYLGGFLWLRSSLHYHLYLDPNILAKGPSIHLTYDPEVLTSSNQSDEL